MAKNKLSKSKMKSLSKGISKYAKDISNTSNQLVKTIEEMNGSVYYGGDAANKWYKKADDSVTSNVNFLKRLESTLAKINELIKKMDNATGGTANSTAGNSSSGAAAAASAAAAMSNNQGSGTGNTGGGSSQPTNPADSSNNKSYGHNDYTPGSNSNNNKSYGHNDYTPGTSNSNSNSNNNSNSASSKTYGHNDYTPGTYENPLAGSMRTPGADYQKKTFFGTTTPKKRGFFD